MPFLARLPGEIPESTVNDKELCSNLDFAQTLLDYAGCSEAKEIDSMQGSSLRQILQGKTPKVWRDAVYYRYWMHLAHHYIPAHYGVRDERYKLVFFYALPLDANLGRGQFEPSTPGWELYDLKTDPNEMNNVYGQPGYDAVASRLKKRLLELKIHYGDLDEGYPELMEVRSAHWGSR